ncbi:MAG: hypothetical protein AB8G05_01235 [Oligoflexales bacterium]
MSNFSFVIKSESDKPYTGGYHSFKKILRLEEDGSKIISCEHTGWQHFKSDYISSAWLNPDGTRVPYCIPLDIDVKDTDKKWLDDEGRINWEKAVAFLQKNYLEIFSYLLFVVRSTAGKGIHLGIAISPIVKDGSEGSIKTAFLAQQAQEALIRLLRHHGLGADNAARGLVREVPNFRRHEVSKYSQAKQLSYNKDIHALIKREGRNVITEILAITNKLKECRPKAKKDQEEILHPHKTTEARLAHLYVDLFDNLGQSKCYTMAELIKLTQISRATLRNILVSRPKSRPKWLNVNYLNKSEGYELWINPEFGDIERAVKLIENPEYASTFLKDLKLPEEVEDGERNAWLSSAAIYYKWHGYSKHQTLIALNHHTKQIPGYEDSRNCKSLTRIVGSVYRNQPQMLGIKSGKELPLALRKKTEVKNNIEGPYSTGPFAAGNTHYSLAFTRRGNEKHLVNLGENQEQSDTSIVEGVEVRGTGYKLQLRAIQELLGKLDEKPSKLIVKGQSMLQANPVVDKFAKYYGFEFEFAERDADDKRLLKEFRESNLEALPSMDGVEVRTSIDIPDLYERKVRLDGYLEHQRCFYWLGDSWIGRKLQVVDDGTNIEFFEKAQFIRGYNRLSGKGAKTEGGTNSQWHKAKSLDSTYRRKAQKVGPSFDQLILAQIEKGQGIINTKFIFGFLKLMDSWPWEQLEAVAKYCARRRNYSYRFFNSCLEAGVE